MKYGNSYSGECECKSMCTSPGPTVCGTDNVSYASECHLAIRSCILVQQGSKQIRVKNIGTCGKFGGY